MDQAQISFDLVGSALGEDIFSEQGILLLKKGTILKEVHILLLQKYRFGKTVSVDLNENIKKISPSEKPYQTIQAYIKDTFQSFYRSKEINIVLLRERFHPLIELSLCDVSILKVLQTEGKKDEQLYQHSINVGILSSIIGKLLGYKKKDCLLLADMGLLHEIGMLGVDKNIYKNTNSIDNEEIQKHTEIGHKLLNSIPYINSLIPLAALHHHEKINGTGYPKQLKEKDIPYFVQIVSVADCFNSVYMNIHDNGEKKPNFAGVYELIEKAQKNELNPAIVIPFVRYIMRQNLLQKVRLSDGKEAQIVFIHENEPYQPLVKVGEEYVDLRREAGVRIESLVGEGHEVSV
ncbi:hypothetical protein AMS60_22430 [Bacillus sp. FJAT-21945]|nr:hypothetical protein AMS60_22430 [Bacillus sp. FJAT-21945]